MYILPPGFGFGTLLLLLLFIDLCFAMLGFGIVAIVCTLIKKRITWDVWWYTFGSMTLLLAMIILQL